MGLCGQAFGIFFKKRIQGSLYGLTKESFKFYISRGQYVTLVRVQKDRMLIAIQTKKIMHMRLQIEIECH